MNRRNLFGLLAVLPFVRFEKPEVKPEPKVYYTDTDSIVADKAYFASKVEVFPGDVGEGFRMYDINSSFPICMQLYYPDGRRRPMTMQLKRLLNRLYGKHAASNHVA